MDETNQESSEITSGTNIKNCDYDLSQKETTGTDKEEPAKEQSDDTSKCSFDEKSDSSTNGVHKLADEYSVCDSESVSNLAENKSEIQSQYVKPCEELHNEKVGENSNSDTEPECINRHEKNTDDRLSENKGFTSLNNSSASNCNINLIEDVRSTRNEINQVTARNDGEENVKSDVENLDKDDEKEDLNSMDTHKSTSNEDKSLIIEKSPKEMDVMVEQRGERSCTKTEIMQPKENYNDVNIHNETQNKSENTQKTGESESCKECLEITINSPTGVKMNDIPTVMVEDIKSKYLNTSNIKSVSTVPEIETENLTNNISDNEVNKSDEHIDNFNNNVMQEGDNQSRSENDSTEVVDTEIVNCNDIELIDLNENELQNDKEIDRIGTDEKHVVPKDGQENNESEVDILDTSVEKNKLNEKFLKTGSESVHQKEDLAFDATIHQPDVSDEETITSDTSTCGVTTNVEESKLKDEDLCIIPDKALPKLSAKQQSKVKHCVTTNEAETITNSGKKEIYSTSSDSEKLNLRTEGQKPEGSDISKFRPTRNAAKLAGNKIRSLVLNDFFSEGHSSRPVRKEEGDVPTKSEESHRLCAECKGVKLWKFLMVHGNTNQYLCSEQCSEKFTKRCEKESESLDKEQPEGELSRKCAHCQSQITANKKCLFWETMDFCNEVCLGQYQAKLGSNCANCKGDVYHTNLGKYGVRFGCDIKQFCSAACLEEYKKGLKVCSYCQKDISVAAEGFLAPVGDKGQFKDFCTQFCMQKYEQRCSTLPNPSIIEVCSVCSNSKPVQVEVQLDERTHKLCSEPCFAAFKFVNNITEGHCDMCNKYFDRSRTENYSIFVDDSPRSFCCKTCFNVYILANRKIVPCSWCKVKKYNFDMIRKGCSSDKSMIVCSLNCLNLYQLSMNSSGSKHVKCDFCLTLAQAKYHITVSDTTIRNFCSYNCLASFQAQYSNQSLGINPGSTELSSPIPTGTPRRTGGRKSQAESLCVPIISSVQSLASTNDTSSNEGIASVGNVTAINQPNTMPQLLRSPKPSQTPQIYQQIITKPAPAKEMKNKSILCKPYSHTKGVSCRPHPCMKETQTDQSLNKKFLIPIPVPIYVPAPMHMFATPFPVPVPFPLPVPVPIFIPTTRNSAKGIFKEIKKIQEKIPTDPFEAELLMMAEMVAGEKKQDPTDSESEDCNDGEDGGDGTFSPENVDASNTFGDDMLQMALKMASELEEPAVDMESVLTSNTITTTQPPVDPNKTLYDQVQAMSMSRGRKRSSRGSRSSAGGTPNKRGRRTSGSADVPLLPPPEPIPPPRIEVEKPDADMCLKYTFGVNAWRHWVMQKNAELEKVAMTNRKIKLFKPELLQLTADELNFSLCLFVKEVRKPNGTEYAPDTIYYLCLGIQQYLFENGRIDNIFTDSYYEKFTDCLDEVAKKFAALYNDSQYIVTRVEEEHLWESKQLGAHSPHVLLSTLMFFNTKHFNLVTVEEHMQLSFSHIMKHWKRNPNSPGVAKVPGSRNVLLRFYPPQSALEANSRKKKVYEQQENEENPLRCPVKLYEFYLSKCPESVKTRNDVFYLLPERSCVPDSPVWYSTMALGKEPLMKMLHRVKMVKEINIALLSC